ncbi:hypothetical protein H4S03_006681 [Coemansia sp. S3946]|nr:hypothetical protein H4S03_006681 [Coemansia sp. S3946]
MKLSKTIIALASLGLTTFAHQGCDIDTAINTLLSEATIGHISEAILRSLQHDVKNAIQDLTGTGCYEEFSYMLELTFH